MRWQAPVIVLTLGLAIPLGYLAWRGLLLAPEDAAVATLGDRGTADDTARIANSVEGLRTVSLYFSDAAGLHLVPERREIAGGDDRLALLRALVRELASGPASADAVATLPASTQLRHVFLDDAGTAYLDFERSAWERHVGGTHAERMTVLSLAETLGANFEDIRSLRILVDGVEPMTLRGHLSPELARASFHD